MTESRTPSSYGVTERSQASDDAARHAERIRLAGYTILPTGWSAEEIGDLGRRLDRVLERQAAEFGGVERLRSVGDSATARCPLAYDDTFLQLVTHPALLAICRALLGDYIIVMQQNGVSVPPLESHTQTAYHRDLPYQHFVSSRPLAISALFCIDPFRPETGATLVLPGSHKVEMFPSEEVASSLETSIVADSGSYIVFDSMLFHRAGSNRSSQPRRAVNQVLTVPIISQQISLSQALGGRHADDPALARLLGYDAAPAASVVEWRERRLARAAARTV